MKIQRKTFTLLSQIHSMDNATSEGITKDAILLEVQDAKESTINSLVNRGFLQPTGKKIHSSSKNGRSSKVKAYFLTKKAEEAITEYENSHEAPIK